MYGFKLFLIFFNNKAKDKLFTEFQSLVFHLSRYNIANTLSSFFIQNLISISISNCTLFNELPTVQNTGDSGIDL